MNVTGSGGGNDIRKCPMHDHEVWEIVLHKSGHVTSVIGNQEYQIVEGDIMVIPPGMQHNGISDTLYSDIFVSAKQLDFPKELVVHDNDGNVLVLMNMLQRVFLEREENYGEIADCLLETICQYIKKLSRTATLNPMIYRMKNRIYENMDNPDFDLKKEIQLLGMNRDYFRRKFKEETGKTPLEYLTWIRMSRAVNLLEQNTFVGVEHVSFQCGFRDSFYFSTCFKKHMGVSPLQYRKGFLENESRREKTE